MASFNRIIMMGNLTRDPDRKQLSSGHSVCRLGLASNRQFKNKQGSMTQEVCFVDVEVWGAQAESCQQYLQKGKPVLVEGRLKLDSWDDNGVRRSKHYIVADRVTFLASSAQQEEFGSSDDVSENFSSYEQAVDNGVTGEVKKKREAKSKDTIKTAPSSFTSTIGEIDFKAEQPFDDELPF